MCFSFKISISSFLISWVISLYLLNKKTGKKLSKKQHQTIIFLMIFTSMQIPDAILWYIKMEKNIINYIVTSFFIPTILSLQIIYNIFIINNIDYNDGIKSTCISLSAIIACLYFFYKFNGYSISSCSSKLYSPIWGSNEIQLWEAIIFSFIVFYPKLKSILITNFVILPIIFLKFSGGYGSMWCFISTFFSFYYLYVYHLIHYF
jgi:hypothetical protein